LKIHNNTPIILSIDSDLSSIFGEDGLEFLNIWDVSLPKGFLVKLWDVSNGQKGTAVLAVMFHSLKSFWAHAFPDHLGDASTHRVV